MMKKMKALIIGAGSRGTAYADAMKQLPEQFEIVAVADPMEGRCKAFRERYGIAEEMCFTSYEDVLSRPKLADLAVICTMDDQHYEPALKAIALGYDLLLEKPLAQTAKECTDIAMAANKKGVKVLVCHVLRYTPFYKTIKKLVMDGVIGDIMSTMHVEAVGNIHQSHSYVRGNWHCEADTTPMLLAKCCHDIDIIQWLIDKPCKKVQSFGSLRYFTPHYAPEGAPKRCIDGCPVGDTCPYNSVKLYYDDKDNDWFRKASTVRIAKEEVPTDDEVMQALKTTDYGLCVFRANNDVVDHQTVNFEFEGGITSTLTMNAFNFGGRYIRLFGTKGELYANMEDEEITVNLFEGKQQRKIKSAGISDSILSGHGGGDIGIIMELYDYMSDSYDGYCAADIDISVKNHLIGFAAEEARRNGTVVDVDRFFGGYGIENK